VRLRRATGAFCRNPRRGGTDDLGFTGNRPFRDAAVYAIIVWAVFSADLMPPM